MLRVHRSNRLEVLVEALALSLGESGDPIAPEEVVVHSRAMERWLSQRLSQRLGAVDGEGGVAANVQFPFPAAVIRRAVSALAGEGADGVDPWSPDALAWSLLSLLPEHLDDRDFAPLRRYLGTQGEAVDRRAYNLARHVADLFDRYITYRPDWAVAWSQGRTGKKEPDVPGSAWQRKLFRAVGASIGAPSPAERIEAALERLRHGGDPTGLPARVSFFGVTALPPRYLDLLVDLARVVDVDLYVLCPSNQYWGDVRSRREIAEGLRLAPKEEVTAKALHLEEGNPLLASLGRMGRDFQVVLEGRDSPPYELDPGDRFHDPLDEGPATALAVLQSDVLELRHRGGSGEADLDRRPPPAPLRSDDRSLQVHACHGAARQVEVLRDELLRLFDEDEALEPRDVLVMTPDIESFAPLVSAVFSEGEHRADPTAPPGEQWAEGGGPRLPFTIADRSLRRQNPVAEALMRVVELAGSRVTASQLLDLVALEPVRRRFDLDADDLPQIEGWVRDSGIRWAMDGAHRGSHDQPEDQANTFRFGLDRLLLGVAMPGEGSRLFGEVLPVDEMEGQTVALLGRFVELCETLFAELRALAGERSLTAWLAQLEATLTAVTATTERAAWLTQQVRDALTAIGDEGAEGFLDGKLSLDGLRAVLDRRLSIEVGQVGQHTGAITFCALAPMRSVPHGVICLLGMDDDAFPRKSGGLGFDLVHAAPRLGDRSPRDEDRLLFLEAILAARKHLLITYTGRDARNNEPRPPAVPVGELLDVVDDSFEVEGEGPAREGLLRVHPLQPFSPRCFGVGDDGGPVEPISYDRRLCEGARGLLGRRQELPPFFEEPLEPLSATGEGLVTVALSDLVRFFVAPARFLLGRRLGIYLGEELHTVEDREPLELDPLEAWSVGSDLLAAHVDGRGPELAARVVRAAGRLPLGTPGEVVVADAAVAAQTVFDVAAPHLGGDPRAIRVSEEVAGVLLEGRVDRLHDEGQRLVTLQYGKIKPKQLVAPWINHLALALAAPELEATSILVGRRTGRQGLGAGMVELGPLGESAEERRDGAAKILAHLLDLFHRGQNEPLRFFPATSWAYAEVLAMDPEDTASALAAAAKTWRPATYGGDGSTAEGEEAHNRQAFSGDEEPFAQVDDDGEPGVHPDFDEAARAMWATLFEAWRLS